mmetsp:Transcript_7414/g.22510  ORF Transcript_7414/g.22510 Transcript_7414/m.22510 type:complete len:228 (+) Transcript_7414:119-802(+)
MFEKKGSAVCVAPAYAFMSALRFEETYAAGGGWHLHATRGAILDTEQRQQWQEDLDVCALPSMLFGATTLSLRHAPSGACFRFDARGALTRWAQDKEQAPAKVALAAAWAAARSETIARLGTVSEDYDWTFSTRYVGESEGARWEAGGPGLDKALLTARDPILFYQEAVLYEDELDDNGVSVASVKVRGCTPRYRRLMPSFLTSSYVQQCSLIDNTRYLMFPHILTF